jgi:tetratricopeptide (TPR) repeat protein
MIRPLAVVLTASLLGVAGCSLKQRPTSSIDPTRPARATALNVEHAHAHYTLGRIALDEGRTKQALKSFRQSRQLKPTFEEAWNGEGIALLDEKRYTRAAAHYLAMREALPESVLAIEGQAAASLGLRNVEAAKAFALEAIARDEKSSQGYRILGEVAYIKGEFPLAVENWRRALELNPSLGPTLRPVVDDVASYSRKYSQ